MAAKVAVVGGVNLDLVVETAALPLEGETVLGGDLRRFGGGKGANQAVAAARMGAEVAIVARVGRDEFGESLLADLARESVDVSRVVRDDGPTGTALITVAANGANTIVVAPGANARLGVEDVEAARPTVESSDVLLLQLEVPLEASVHAARIGRAAGGVVFLNPSPARPLPADLLDGLDVLVLNETELAVLGGAGDDGRSLLARGVRSVVLTRGAAGAQSVTPAGTRAVAPFRVQSVDATAAGDAFLGALAATLPELGLDRALDVAAAAGALATTRLGAQPSLPRRDEVETLLRTGRRG